MQARRRRNYKKEQGLTLIEVLLAIVILLVGLVAVALLVPASLSSNNGNRKDSVAMVLAQRELDQMLDQPIRNTQFTDVLGNVCSLGNPGAPNTVVGSPVVTIVNRPAIDFTAGQVPGYSFNYVDPEDPYGATYDVRWAVITTANAGTANSKRFILGARQIGGTGGFVQPLTLDTMVEK
jgi:prepilin-type N-terminal cleavage/methylation domain-containing protein